MWTISALKERARERKKTNRWKMILVALILTIAAGTNVSLNYGLDWLTDTTDGQETVYEVSPGEDVYGPDIVIEEPAYTDMEMGIAAVIFGKFSPEGAVKACLLFGFCSGIRSLASQSNMVSPNLISMIPYIVTILALVLFVGKAHTPAANGKIFVKSR